MIPGVGYLITAGVVRLLKVDRETMMRTIQPDLEKEKRRTNYHELNAHPNLKPRNLTTRKTNEPMQAGQTRLSNNAPIRTFCAMRGSTILSPPCRSTTGWRSAAQRRWEGLPLRDAADGTVWRKPDSGPMQRQLIWAPELHHIDGKWYIYFAAAHTQALDAPGNVPAPHVCAGMC